MPDVRAVRPVHDDVSTARFLNDDNADLATFLLRFFYRNKVSLFLRTFVLSPLSPLLTFPSFPLYFLHPTPTTISPYPLPPNSTS